MFLKALSIKDHLKKKYFQNIKNENETDNLNSNKPETTQNNPKKTIQRPPLNKFQTRPLSIVNEGVKQLHNVDGVFMKDLSIFSNMFFWNTKCVLGIYEGDRNGRIIEPDSQPILYAVAKIGNKCSCNKCDLTEIAITTSIDQEQSQEPFIYMKELDKCCHHNPCSFFINEQGNQTHVGVIQRGTHKHLTLSNQYVYDLEMSIPFCNFYCNQIEYRVQDGHNIRSLFIKEKDCCSCTNPINYRLGFPQEYNEDQNINLLAMAVYFTFLSKDIHCSDRT